MPFKRKKKRQGRLRNVYDPNLTIQDTHGHTAKAEARREKGGTGTAAYEPKVNASMCGHYDVWCEEEDSDLGLINIREEPHRFVSAFLQRLLIPKGGTWQTLSLQTVQNTWMKQWGNFIFHHLPPECCSKGKEDIEVWSQSIRDHPDVKAVLREAKRVSRVWKLNNNYCLFVLSLFV